MARRGDAFTDDEANAVDNIVGYFDRHDRDAQILSLKITVALSIKITQDLA